MLLVAYKSVERFLEPEPPDTLQNPAKTLPHKAYGLSPENKIIPYLVFFQNYPTQ
jgi:hypothetical protein